MQFGPRSAFEGSEHEGKQTPSTRQLTLPGTVLVHKAVSHSSGFCAKPTYLQGESAQLITATNH